MDRGCHFALNQTLSRFQDDVRIFDYLGVTPDPSAGFPVYLVFSKEGVRFFVHVCQSSSEGVQTVPSGGLDHYSGCILFLPSTLDLDFRTELSTTLESVFDLSISGVKLCGEDSSPSYSSGVERDSEPLVQRLLLDFIFEMEHGSVFQHDALYDDIYAILHSHYLYNAIVAKAEYRYYRDRYETDNSDRIALNYLVRAERKWVEIISDRRSDLIFHESKWFSEAVEEMIEVYQTDKTGLDVCHAKAESGQEDLRLTQSVQTADMSIQWFMGKYRPDGALCVGLGKCYKKTISFLFICLTALSVVFVVHAVFAGKFLGPLSELTVFRALLWGLLCLFLLFCLGLVNKSGRERVRFRSFLSVLVPRLFAAIAAGWMTVGLGDVIAKIDDTVNSGIPFPYAPSFVMVGLTVTVFLVLFLWYSVFRILPYHKKRVSLFLTFWLFLLSFTYSVFIGAGLMHLFGGSSFLMSDNPAKVKTLLVFSFISMFVGVFIQFLVQDKSVSSSDL